MSKTVVGYDDHTLLITTYDRPAFLRRLLEFVAAGGPVGRILVADASSDAVKAVNARRIARLRSETGLDVAHRLFDHDLSVIELHVAGVEAVDTPFMTFVADDDFVVPAALRESVDFLRNYPDHAACAGRFAFAGRSSAGTVTRLSLNAAIEMDDPAERFTALLTRYWSVEFGTWRTEVKRAAFAAFDVFALDEALGEPLHALCAALHGKIHVVERISSIRTNHEANNARRDLDRRLLFTRPEFPVAFASVEAMVRSALADRGRPCPDGLAQRLMGALLRHFIDNHSYFRNAIGYALAGQLWPDMETADGEQVLAQMRAAFDATFLGDDAAGFRAAHERAREAKVTRPGTRDDRLMTLTGDRLVMHDLAGDPADLPGGDPLAAAIAMLDRIVSAYAALLLDPGFTSRYGAFRARLAAGLRERVGAGTEALLDALFIVMLAEDLGMHARPHGDTLADIMQRLPARRGDRDEIGRLTAACLATRDHPDARLWTEAEQGAGPETVVSERPDVTAVPVPGAVGVAEARQVRDTTLVPLAPGTHERAWLHVRLRLQRGRLQLCLVREGNMAWTVTAWPTPGLKSYYLPIIGAPEWLAIRDIGAGREPAHATLDTIELLACAGTDACEAPLPVEAERPRRIA